MSDRVFRMNQHAALTNVYEVGLSYLASFGLHKNGQVEAGAVIAKASVKNHAARRGECANCLFHGDGLLKGEECAGGVEARCAALSTHDDERNRALMLVGVLQLAQELRTAIQIAVDDQCVNLGLSQPFEGFLWFFLNGNVNLKTAEDAFENADFLPVTRKNNRGKCHADTLKVLVIAA